MARTKKHLTPTQQAFKKEYQRIMNAVKRAEKKGYIFDSEKLPKIPTRITERSVSKLQKIKPIDLRKKAQKVDFESGELISGKKAIKLEKKEARQKAKETRERNKLERDTLDTSREITSRSIEQDEDYNYTPNWYDPHYEEYEGYTPLEEVEPVTINPEPITTPDGYEIDPETGEILKQPEPKPKHDREKYKEKYKQNEEKRQQDSYPKFSSIVIQNFREDISHFPKMAEPMLSTWVNELMTQYGEDDVAEMLQNAKADGVWIDYTIAYARDLLLGMIADMMEYLPDASDWFKQDLYERFEYDEDWEYPT